MEVTDDKTHDGEKLKPLVGKEKRNVKKVVEDGGYDAKVGYGQRGIAESFFSAFKRLFGDVVYAKRFERMVKEIEFKVCVYNPMLGHQPSAL